MIVPLLERLEELKSFFERLNASPSIKQCDVCKPSQKQDASFRCKECKENLCPDHEEIHKKYKEHHKVFLIADSVECIVLEPFQESNQRPFCNQHSSEKLNLYCLKCNVVMCSHCLVDGDHGEHKSTLYSKVIAQKKNQTCSLIDQVENRRQIIETALSLINQVDSRLCRTESIQRERIISFLDLIKNQIEEFKQNLTHELDEKSGNKHSRLNLQRKQLEMDLECLDNSVSAARCLVRNATDEQFEKHLPLITDQLNRLNNDESFSNPPIETKHLELVVENRIDVSALLSQYRLIEIEDTEQETKTDDEISAIETKAEIEIEIETEIPISPLGDLCLVPRDYKTVVSSKHVIGIKGSKDIQFKRPHAIVEDHLNRIIISDTNNHCVYIFDAQWQHIKTIGSFGSDDGQFNEPRGVAVDELNRIIVADSLNHRVQIFDSEGNHISTFGSNGKLDGQFDSPDGIAVSRDNKIVVCDWKNHRIQIFNAQGNHIKSIGKKGSKNMMFNNPHGVTVDHQNRIIVCEWSNNRVQIFDIEGNHILSFGAIGKLESEFDRPWGVAVDLHDNIIVSEWGNSRVQVFDQHGAHIKTIGSKGNAQGAFNGLCGVAVDHANNLFTSEWTTSRVQIF